MRTPYTACWWCKGTGHDVNAYTGELDASCWWCKGSGVQRARDAKGRFTTVELEVTSALWPIGGNTDGD